LYQYQEYPRYLYHRTEKPVIVDGPEEHDALGEGWETTPAVFLALPEPPAPPAPPEPPADETKKKKK
jgi:hypothetical protein